MFEWFWKRKDKEETRNAGGYTAQIIGAREAWIAGQSGLADATATVQGAVSLWEGAMAPLCQRSCPPLYFSSISQVGGIGR